MDDVDTTYNIVTRNNPTTHNNVMDEIVIIINIDTRNNRNILELYRAMLLLPLVFILETTSIVDDCQIPLLLLPLILLLQTTVRM